MSWMLDNLLKVVDVVKDRGLELEYISSYVNQIRLDKTGF